MRLKLNSGRSVIPLVFDSEGSGVCKCFGGDPAKFERIEEEIESSFELKRKYNAKRSNSRPDIRFRLKRTSLQNTNPIKVDYKV